ncbi:MAG: gliding motility-associated C-terminal domain-containing protein [Bacteroidetes bacterium]|nr:gliding motility-associated C-terminal domain-containing protein [Bacteroidota bacterium]
MSKKIYTSAVFLLLAGYAFCQTVIWSENFDTSPNWTLNVVSGTEGTPNSWEINNLDPYSAPNSLHICDPFNFCADIFLAAAYVANAGYETDRYSYNNTDIDLSSYAGVNVTWTFRWQSYGQANADYGLIGFSTNGGSTFTWLSTKYQINSSWLLATVTLTPAQHIGSSTFRIAYRWINNGDGFGNDPPFNVDDIELSVPAACAMTATATAAPASVCQGSSTSLNVTQSGGSAPFTFSWTSTPAGFTSSIQSPSATPSATTTYNVTVTDGSACTATGSTLVTVNTPPTLTPSTTPAACGSNNGTASANPSAGTPPYTCTWSNSQTVCNATGLASATYTVTVTDGAGCTAVTTAAVGSTGGPSISTSSTPTNCSANTGTATVDASGGNAPYTYNWSMGQSGSGGTSHTATGLGQGTYTVTVTDNAGCTATTTATVNPSSAPSVSASSTSTGCTSNTGTATASASGGTTPYTFNWSNGQSGSGGTTHTATALAAATYTVTVTDNAGCTATTTTIVSTVSGPSVSATSTGTGCSSPTGTATASASGGTTPYTFEWSNGQSGSGGTSHTATALGAATYTVTVTDAAGCTATTTAIVSTSSGPSVSTSTTSTGCSGSTGTATANASGGTTPYTFNWSMGQSGSGGTTHTATGLAMGTYTITVTDAAGCTASTTANVNASSGPSVTTSSTAAGCSVNDGTATANASGGASPYTFNWSVGQSSTGGTSHTATGLGAGNYSITVTDATGCTGTASVSVTSPGAPSLSTSSTPATCGAANGSATVTASGGNPPYTYNWSNGQTTSIATGLIADTFSVTVTGSAGGQTAFWSEDFTSGGTNWTLNISGPGTNDFYSNEWVINSDYSPCTVCGTSGGNFLHITCSSLDGTWCPIFGGPACVYNAGGIDPIQTDKYVSSQDISTGGYSNITLKFWYQSVGQVGSDYGKVRFSNDGGTTWSADLVASYSGTSSCTQASISVPAAYENIPNFRIGFRWVNDNATGNDPPFSIDDIELLVSAGSGCPSTATVTVGQNNTLTLSTTTTPTSCGQNDGTATVNASNGTPPFSYIWSNSQTGSTATGLVAGSYTVTVADAGGCTSTASSTLTSAGGPTPFITTFSPLCAGGTNGIATVSASGGTPPYSYNWSNAMTTPNITGTAGTYYVTITDAGGCTVTDTAVITDPPAIILSFTIQNATCGVNDGYAIASSSNGIPPYSYLWSNADNDSANTNLGPEIYICTVTDANGCRAIDTAIISNLNAPIVTITSISDVNCYGNSTGSASTTITGGVTPYTFNWSNGSTTQNLTGAGAGDYIFTVTDNDGCITIKSATITQPSELVLSVSATNAICGGTPGQATATVTGGTPGYIYTWSNGSTVSSVSNLAGGAYTVTVTDTLNCSKNTSVTITDSSAVTLDAGNDTTLFAGSAYTVTASAGGGTAPWTFTWMPGNLSDQTVELSPSESTTYSVTATDASDCSGFDSLMVTVINCVEPFIPSAFSPNNDKKNDILYIRGFTDDCTEALNFVVYNRWGQKVFETTTVTKGWDGTFNGKILDTGVFAFYLSAKWKGGEEKVKKGNVTLVR